jgi:4-hydroxy-tetrahydrodipicolinate reductase
MSAEKNKIRLAVCGAGGRMGLRIIALAAQQPESFQLVAAIDRPDSPLIGQDTGAAAGIKPNGVKISASIDAVVPANVLIDFSALAATRGVIDLCAQRGIAMVIGTTGLGPQEHRLIDTAVTKIAILQTGNTSLGINVLLDLAAQIARKLGPAYDIELVEVHHNQKKDAPSGTALSLLEHICAATGREVNKSLVHGRHGPEASRTPGSIGVHAVRMGDVVGEHTVYFSAVGERLEIKHVATTRDTFAYGALRAAEFISGRPPGRYTMADVLGLNG